MCLFFLITNHLPVMMPDQGIPAWMFGLVQVMTLIMWVKQMQNNLGQSNCSWRLKRWPVVARWSLSKPVTVTNHRLLSWCQNFNSVSRSQTALMSDFQAKATNTNQFKLYSCSDNYNLINFHWKQMKLA